MISGSRTRSGSIGATSRQTLITAMLKLPIFPACRASSGSERGTVMKFQSYWHETAPVFAGAAQGPVEGHYDVAIVGGGFTGLAAARHLAKAGASVVVLEAERVGWGASGRNGGHLNNG